MREFLIDTDILSIFAKANGLSTLCRLLECEKLPITPGILDELLVPLEYGYDFPRDILSMAEITLDFPTKRPFLPLRKRNEEGITEKRFGSAI